MKKSLLVLLAIVFAISLNTKAEDFSAVYNGDTIYYNITSSVYPYTAKVTFRGETYLSYLNEYIDSVSIPDSVHYNGNYYRVTAIGDSAFLFCTGLRSINIPNSVTSIGNQAFNTIWGLHSINIPNSVTSIGDSAYAICTFLESVTIPNSVTHIGAACFLGCHGLYSITIPESVKRINPSTFESCLHLTTVNLPDSLTSIGEFAFYNSMYIDNITIPSSVTSIGAYAFDNTIFYIHQPNGLVYFNNVLYNYKGSMPQNTSIAVQDGTVSISGNAFKGCSGLTSIHIPNSVNYIGDSAFWDCSDLTSITCDAPIPPVIGNINCFENVNDTIPVYVPCSAISLYQQDSKWSYFTNFLCDPLSINEIQTNISTKLYPNPSNGKSKLEIKGLNSEADVLIYDMVGRVIQKHKVNQNTKELEIDLKSSDKGVYFVRIVNNSIKHTKKLIVK